MGIEDVEIASATTRREVGFSAMVIMRPIQGSRVTLEAYDRAIGTIMSAQESPGAGHNQAYENRLAQETSPYLLQHKHNPVDWWPWGPAALAEAQRSNKPILLSVGYAACHWCHVMAHESFEDDATAA